MNVFRSPLPPFTTVSLQVAQFIARNKPFVADFNVTKAVVDPSRNQSFVDVDSDSHKLPLWTGSIG